MPESDERPLWIPYEPPPPEGWERVWAGLRRLAFPVALLLFAGAVAVVFATDGVPSWLGGAQTTSPAAASLDSAAQAPAVEAPEAPDARSPFARPPGPGALGPRGAGPSGAEPGAGGAPDSAYVSVRVDPATATVLLNGTAVGTAPVESLAVSPGRYLVSGRAPGHYGTDTVVVAPAGGHATFALWLLPRGIAASDPDTPSDGPSDASPSVPPDASSPTASAQGPPASAQDSPGPARLRVASTPSGAQVTLNGQPVGTTPLTVDTLSAGTWTVGVDRAGYAAWQRRVAVDADATAQVDATLEALPATLRVLVRPWGTIYVDNTLQARDLDIWHEMTLPPGPHRVAVVHPVLGRRERLVTLDPGATHSVVVDLQAHNASERP